MVDLRQKAREYAESVKETVRHPVDTARRVKENMEMVADRRAKERELPARITKVKEVARINRLQKEGELTKERAEQWKERAQARYVEEKKPKSQRAIEAGKRAYAAMEAGAEGMERTLPPARMVKPKRVGQIQNLQRGDSYTGLDFHSTPDFSGISGNSKEKRHFAGYSMDFGKLPDFSSGGKGGLPDFSQLDNITGGKKPSRKRR
ncbi:MAG: hypothetical protein MUO73_03410 [Thermoplasmata archaeon]|nr:hypothetical protein [Thermoplasmata archaeon]